MGEIESGTTGSTTPSTVAEPHTEIGRRQNNLGVLPAGSRWAIDRRARGKMLVSEVVVGLAVQAQALSAPMAMLEPAQAEVILAEVALALVVVAIASGTGKFPAAEAPGVVGPSEAAAVAAHRLAPAVRAVPPALAAAVPAAAVVEAGAGKRR